MNPRTCSHYESLDLRQSSVEFNYAAYLLADENGVSIKVAVKAKSLLASITCKKLKIM